MIIWLLITTCIHNRYGTYDPEKRKQEYIESITSSLKVVPSDVRVLIIENSCDGSSYLDQFGNVVYTRNNNIDVPNKAIIEFKDLQDVVRHFKIPETDIVVKLTGRYTLQSGSIFEEIRRSSHVHSAWLKFFNVCTKEFETYDCVMGCYAIRVKELMNLDPNIIGTTGSMEVDFARFLRRTIPLRIKELSSIGLTYRFFDGCPDLMV